MVLGAGVSGLTCAHELAAYGHQVTVVAEKDASQTTSVIAGALWEWPPAVCGHHNDVLSLKRSKPWCVASYRKFKELSLDSRTGVRLEQACFYFYGKVDDSEFERAKMNECRQHVDDFQHDASLIQKNKVNEQLGLVDAYSYLAPVIDTPVYTRWLRERLGDMGVRFVNRKLSGTLESNVDILDEFAASELVNCTGLGAQQLASDEVFPLRGALIQVQRNSTSDAPIQGAHCITHDENKPHQNMIYLVPRGDKLLLGGIAQPNRWEDSLDLDDSIVQGILKRCHDFMPQLKSYPIDEKCPTLVGLRPARHKNVRLEKDLKQPFIHNYGHGGSGYSLSWGCAKEVAELVASS